MTEQNDSGGSSGGGGAGGGGGANRNRNRSRNRNRNRNRSGTGGADGNSSGSGAAPARSAPNGQRSSGGGQRSMPGAPKSGQGARQGGGRRPAQGAGKNGNRSRPQGRSGQSRAPVALAPPPPLAPLPVEPGLGAPQVYPAEVAANRRRAIALCAYTAVLPALLVGVLCGVALSIVVGVVAFVACGAAVMYAVWRLAPSFALRRVGAQPVEEHDDPRLFNVTEGLCATFGLAMPALHVLDDATPNACALGRDAQRSDLVVTSGLLRLLDPIELEGVIAHELAHVKRGDNGLACVGITLASMVGGERTLRRCVGENREYRADVVGASAVRFPRGLLGALGAMTEAPAPVEGSFFATPSRLGPTRWVWIDPFVGHRDDDLVPGDLDATSVRVAALREW